MISSSGKSSIFLNSSITNMARKTAMQAKMKTRRLRATMAALMSMTWRMMKRRKMTTSYLKRMMVILMISSIKKE